MLQGKWVACKCSEFAHSVKQRQKQGLLPSGKKFSEKRYNTQLLNYVRNEQQKVDSLKYVKLDDRFILARKDRYKKLRTVPKGVVWISNNRGIWVKVEVLSILGRGPKEITKLLGNVDMKSVSEYIQHHFNYFDKDPEQVINYFENLTSLTVTDAQKNANAYQKGRNMKRDVYAFHHHAVFKTMSEHALLSYIGVEIEKHQFADMCYQSISMLNHEFVNAMMNQNMDRAMKYAIMFKMFGDQYNAHKAIERDEGVAKKFDAYIKQVQEKQLPHTTHSIPVHESIPITKEPVKVSDKKKEG